MASNDHQLVLKKGSFKVIRKGWIAHSIELLDKCQGRELTYFEFNGLLEHIVPAHKKTPDDDNFLRLHLLELIYNLEHLLDRMKHLQMSTEFVFFNHRKDTYYKLKEIPKHDDFVIVDSKKTLMLEKVDSACWELLVREVILGHLQKLNYTCHVFDSVFDKELWERVDEFRPSFFIMGKDDFILRSLSLSYCCPVVSNIDVRSNVCYGFLSYVKRSSYSKEAVEQLTEFTKENRQETSETITYPLIVHNEDLKNLCDMLDGEELQSTMYFILQSLENTIENERDNFALFYILQVLSTLLCWKIPLALRTRNISVLGKGIFHKFVDSLYFNMFSILIDMRNKRMSLKAYHDLLDVRLLLKLVHLFYNEKSLECNTSQEFLDCFLFDSGYRPFLEKVLFRLNEKCGKDIVASAHQNIELKSILIQCESITDSAKSTFKFHPIENELCNRILGSTENIYSPEESEDIIEIFSCKDSAKGPVFETDTTHWKSRRQLEFYEEERTTTKFILQKESLNRYAKSLGKNEIVYLNKEDAIRNCFITQHMLEELHKNFQAANNFTEMKKNVLRMMETWISSIRIQHYSQSIQEKREELLILIADSLLKMLETLSGSTDDELLLLFESRAIYNVFKRACEENDQIYSCLQDSKWIISIVKILFNNSRTKCLAMNIIKQHPIEAANFEQQFSQLTSIDQSSYNERQFKDYLFPDYLSLIYPRIYEFQKEHNIERIVLQFTPDPWQEEAITVMNNNFREDYEKKSLLITTPTSSGKTFITHYLIERLLKSDDTESIIVFVCPTNALGNQYYSDIQSKFNKESPDKPDIAGIFYSEARINVEKCRVLVTNAACLEILMLHYAFDRKISHIILDEIHHIGDESVGMAYEHIISLSRSPIVALSASISNSEDFITWLQSVSKAKKIQIDIELIPKNKGRMERLQPLEYYLFNPGKENQYLRIHPLAVFNQHNIKSSLHNMQQMSKEQHLELFRASEELSNKLGIEDPMKELRPSMADVFDNLGLFCEKKFQHYKEQVRNLLLKMDTKYLLELRNDLSQNFENYYREQETEPSLRDTVPQCLISLAEKKLTPAIIFHFSKNGINSLITQTIKTLILEGKSLFSSANQQEAFMKEIPQIGHFEGSLLIVKLSKNLESNKKLRDLVIEHNIKHHLHGEDEMKIDLIHCDNDGSKKLFNYFVLSKHLKDNKYEISLDITDDILPIAFRFGIAAHHNSIDDTMLQDIERLFRMKLLPVCFATGTLSFGISMPTKTVVIADDSMYFTNIYFQQCAGRSGRRNFDPKGHVILLSLTKERISRYLTNPIPNINGSIGLTTTFILRLITFYSLTVANYSNNLPFVNQALENSFAALNQPLSITKNSDTTNQQQHYVKFALNFLRQFGLLDQKGRPINLSGLASRLHHAEPSNLMFIKLLREANLTSNSIYEYTREEPNTENEKRKRQDADFFLKLLGYLFERRESTRKTLCPSNEFKLNAQSLFDVCEDFNNSLLEEYIEYVENYAKANINNIKDCILPLSKVEFEWIAPNDSFQSNSNLLICLYKDRNVFYSYSSFSALSGYPNGTVYQSFSDLKENIKKTIIMEHSLIPTIDVSTPVSSYIIDFFYHGEYYTLVKEHSFLNETQARKQVESFLKIVKKLSGLFSKEKDHTNKITVDDIVSYNGLEAQVVSIRKDVNGKYKYKICIVDEKDNFQMHWVPSYKCKLKESNHSKSDDRLFNILKTIKHRLGTFYENDENEQMILIQLILDDYNVEKKTISDKLSTFTLELSAGKKTEVLNSIQKEKESIYGYFNNPNYQKTIRLLDILYSKAYRLNFHFEKQNVRTLLRKLKQLDDKEENFNLELEYGSKDLCRQTVKKLTEKYPNNDYLIEEMLEIVEELPFSKAISKYAIGEMGFDPGTRILQRLINRYNSMLEELRTLESVNLETILLDFTEEKKNLEERIDNSLTILSELKLNILARSYAGEVEQDKSCYYLVIEMFDILDVTKDTLYSFNWYYNFRLRFQVNELNSKLVKFKGGREIILKDLFPRNVETDFRNISKNERKHIVTISKNKIYVNCYKHLTQSIPKKDCTDLNEINQFIERNFDKRDFIFLLSVHHKHNWHYFVLERK